MPTTKFFLSALICLGFPLAAVRAEEASPVPSYQCMTLKNDWNGLGPMPAPVIEYASPSPGAASVGIAMSTLIVDDPLSVVNDRVRVIRPNGTPAWIDSSQVTTWHVASNPSAACSVVRLPNGTLGTTSH